jgi:uncharacterized protein YegP (UPF0339 family)
MGILSKLFGKKRNKKDRFEDVYFSTENSNTSKPKISSKNNSNAYVNSEIKTKIEAEQSTQPTQTETIKPESEAMIPPQKPVSQAKKSIPSKPKPVIKTDSKQETEKEKECPPAQNTKAAPTGFFEIKKSKDDRYVFNLFAANKVIVATSQIYSSSQSALNGIKSVIANAEKAAIEDQTAKNFVSQSFPKWEIYKDKGEQYRFRLSASNGSCICHSQGYTTKASCKNGIESIIRTAKNAKIDKSYLKTTK